MLGAPQEDPRRPSKMAERMHSQIDGLQRFIGPMREELRAAGGERWRLRRVLGEGTYGVVAAGKEDATGEPVALKKVKSTVWGAPLDARRVYREVQVMMHVHHAVVGAHCASRFVGLCDLLVPAGQGGAFWIAMQLADGDLRHVLRSDQPLTYSHCRYLTFQLLHALSTLHRVGVVHRDVCTPNLLINYAGIELRLADFGLARGLPDPGAGGQMAANVCQLPYRAPELLLRSHRYGGGVDVWGAGCVLAELLAAARPATTSSLGAPVVRRGKSGPLGPLPRGRPLFAGGDDTRRQLGVLLRTIGPPPDLDAALAADDGFAPAEDEVGHFKDLLVCSSMKSRSVCGADGLRDQVGGVDAPELSVDLLGRLLTWDPRQRPSAAEALDSLYLAPLRERYADPSDTEPLPRFVPRLPPGVDAEADDAASDDAADDDVPDDVDASAVLGAIVGPEDWWVAIAALADEFRQLTGGEIASPPMSPVTSVCREANCDGLGHRTLPRAVSSASVDSPGRNKASPRSPRSPRVDSPGRKQHAVPAAAKYAVPPLPGAANGRPAAQPSPRKSPRPAALPASPVSPGGLARWASLRSAVRSKWAPPEDVVPLIVVPPADDVASVAASREPSRAGSRHLGESSPRPQQSPRLLHAPLEPDAGGGRRGSVSAPICFVDAVSTPSQGPSTLDGCATPAKGDAPRQPPFESRKKKSGGGGCCVVL